MKIAQRLSSIAPSATLAMTARAKSMRAQGVDVLSLSAGEPDFDTPQHIKDAAVAALQAGDTKYSPVSGSPALRQAVASTVSRVYGRTVQPNEVIVGTGGKQVLFNALACLLDPGDEAIIFAPYWVSYPDMVRFAAGIPVIVETGAANNFVPDAAQLQKAITAKTRVVIINSPSNPTGSTYPAAALGGIAEVVRQHPDIVVITDDIYSGLVFDGPFISFAHIAPDLHDRTLIASGVSKTYSMTGWRIGYGVGPKALTQAMDTLQGSSTSGACSIAQAAAVQALMGDQGEVLAMAQTFAKRRQRMLAKLAEIPEVTVPTPGGAFYVFPKVSAYYSEKVPDSTALGEHLLEHSHVAVVPGGAFGAEDHIRLSFACSDKDIDEGVRRIHEGLRALR